MADPAQDPYEQIAKPIDDPYAGIAKPVGESGAAPAGDRSSPPSAISRLGTGVAQGAGIVSNEQGKNFFLHPIDTAKSILQAQGELGARAGRELKSGDYVRGIAHGAEYLLPGLGPTLAASGDKLEKGDLAGGAGMAIGAALPLAAGKAIPSAGSVAEAGTGGAPARLGTLPSRSILPPETVARSITRAVNPAVNEWPGYIRATADEAGNIRDFAKRSNMPLETQLDWAKAAKGAAEEAHSHFQSQILGPVQGERVATTGTGFKGANAGEGQTATLGEINARIGQINDELRSAYSKREAGQTREALANEPELKAEQKALTDILHSEVAKRTGLTSEQVAGIRQRYGKMYSIADQTEAAVNQRQSSAGKAEEGRNAPLSLGAIAGRAISTIRGGPEGIANASFRSALGRGRAIQSAELPSTNAPSINSPSRTPIWRGISTQDRQPNVVTSSPEEIAASQQRLIDRQAANEFQRNSKGKRIPGWKRAIPLQRGDED